MFFGKKKPFHLKGVIQSRARGRKGDFLIFRLYGIEGHFPKIHRKKKKNIPKPSPDFRTKDQSVFGGKGRSGGCRRQQAQHLFWRKKVS